MQIGRAAIMRGPNRFPSLPRPCSIVVTEGMLFSTFSGGIICASTATYGTESAGTTSLGVAMPVTPQYPLTHCHLFEFDASVSPEIAIRRGADPARLSIWYFTGGQF